MFNEQPIDERKELEANTLAVRLRAHLRLLAERKKVFISSTFLMAVFLTDALPTKIAQFGIEFSGLERERFLTLIALAAGYFLARYTVALIQYIHFRSRHEDRVQHLNDFYEKHDFVAMRTRDGLPWITNRINKPLNFFSDIFQYYSPLIFGLLASLCGFLPSQMDWLKNSFGAA